MSSVGPYLRELRERRGVSLDEISRSTRVLRRYLEALEADDFDALPAPAFIKGFIRAYCQALREPPDEALARYEAGLGPRVTLGREAIPPESPTRPGSRTREENRGRGAVLVSFVLLVVLGAAFIAVTLALQPAVDRGEQRTPASADAPARPEAPPPSAVAETPPVERSPLLPPRPPTSDPTPPVPSSTAPAVVTGVASPYRLVARTSELTWIRVRTEDGRMSEENVPANEVREWVSNRPFVVSIGNAGGVTLELNGRRLPPLGPSGAVIARLVLPSEGQ